MSKRKLIGQCRTCGKDYAFRKGMHFCCTECRFLNYVRKTATCWLWMGSTGSHGYGQLSMNGQPDVAHRVSWRIYKSEVRGELEYICHTCDNRRCVNPAHLFLGTPADNARDMVIKNRDRRRKLSDEQVREIKRALAAGVSQYEIARAYKVTRPNIGYIARGTTFRHI